MTIPIPQWSYRAKLVGVTDGDTIIVTRDLGDRLYQEAQIRLYGLNCPELHGLTHEDGLAAKAFTATWLREAGASEWPLVIETRINRREKYGRLLAQVWRTVDGASLNTDLITAKHAVPFMVD